MEYIKKIHARINFALVTRTSQPHLHEIMDIGQGSSNTPGDQLKDVEMEPQVEMSQCHMDALIQYHHMAILYHIQCMTRYTTPFSLDEEMKTNIERLKQGSLLAFQKPAIFCDVVLKHIGEQVKEWVQGSDAVTDVVAYIDQGNPVYIIMQDNGIYTELNMTKVLILIQLNIDKQVDRKNINYACYCRNVVLLSLLRIIKLAIEYDLPEMSHIMCKKLVDLELEVDDPYKMVDKSISPNMRQTTQAMGEVIYNFGNTLINNAGAENDIVLNSKGVESISGFLTHMSPRIKHVYTALNQILEGGDMTDMRGMDKRVTDTLSSFVSANLHTMMGDRLENLGNTSVNVDRIVSDTAKPDDPPCQKKICIETS